jgi:anaerobic ribonucleoside-triphosphate reductase
MKHERDPIFYFRGIISGIKESIVSRDNYSYKKYQKELTRKKKAEEKRQRKLEKKVMRPGLESGQVPNDQAALDK